MWRKLSAAGAVIVAALLLVLAGVVVSIRFGLQRYSDTAMARFPGDRTEALIRLVDCATCSLEDRNHAVWALGQMVEVRAIHSLKRHSDGQPCSHATRLCQYELRKAIRMIESRPEKPGALWRLASAWYRPCMIDGGHPAVKRRKRGYAPPLARLLITAFSVAFM